MTDLRKLLIEAICKQFGTGTDYAENLYVRVYDDGEGTPLADWLNEIIPSIDAALAEKVEPVAWIQPDHLAKARKSAFLCRVEPKQRDDFVPLYAALAFEAGRKAEREELIKQGWKSPGLRGDEAIKELRKVKNETHN